MADISFRSSICQELKLLKGQAACSLQLGHEGRKHRAKVRNEESPTKANLLDKDGLPP